MLALFVVSVLGIPHNYTKVFPTSYGHQHGDFSGHHGDFNGGPGFIGQHNQHAGDRNNTHLRNQFGHHSNHSVHF